MQENIQKLMKHLDLQGYTQEIINAHLSLYPTVEIYMNECGIEDEEPYLVKNEIKKSYNIFNEVKANKNAYIVDIENGFDIQDKLTLIIDTWEENHPGGCDGGMILMYLDYQYYSVFDEGILEFSIETV